MNRYIVLGAGMMGSAAAYDLAVNGHGDAVLLADRDGDLADRVARAIGPAVRPLELDVLNTGKLDGALDGVSAAVSAMSYTLNEHVTKAAIRAGVHLCDMGGNDDVVERQLLLDGEARASGVGIVPNCGLAPGLMNVLAMTGVESLDSVESVFIRVGGLPQKPRPPLQYQLVFSPEGLLNEYLEPTTVIREGALLQRDSLTELESLEFPPPYGALEAFLTSGGVSMLPRLLHGRIQTLDYKTIRYPGHCERFRLLLDLGFASDEPLMIGSGVGTHREMFTELLRRKLPSSGPDVVLARCTITGRRNGQRHTVAYEMVDHFDAATRMTAMMRTTAFPTTAIARMLADGRITQHGVFTPEYHVPGEELLRELATRNIHITRTVTEAAS